MENKLNPFFDLFLFHPLPSHANGGEGCSLAVSEHWTLDKLLRKGYRQTLCTASLHLTASRLVSHPRINVKLEGEELVDRLWLH